MSRKAAKKMLVVFVMVAAVIPALAGTTSAASVEPMLIDILPGPGSSSPQRLVAVDGV